MKKGLTELVFILDKSGSMRGLESDTIGGFNSMIDKQKKEEGEALVSLVLFDTVSKVVFDRVGIKDIAPLTDKEYTPSGCTALLDAVGDAIHHIGNVHKYARPEDVPEHTLVVITTDGMENASRRYDYDGIKIRIERQKEEHGWEFVFLGANIDAVSVGRQMGIADDRSAQCHMDTEGLRFCYEGISEVVTQCRRTGTVLDSNLEALRGYDRSKKSKTEPKNKPDDKK